MRRWWGFWEEPGGQVSPPPGCVYLALLPFRLWQQLFAHCCIIQYPKKVCCLRGGWWQRHCLHISRRIAHWLRPCFWAVFVLVEFISFVFAEGYFRCLHSKERTELTHSIAYFLFCLQFGFGSFLGAEGEPLHFWINISHFFVLAWPTLIALFV